eukprot:CAMPEP_0204873998 /NCGR_PEP_ID=MMETSP1348-20121228/42145_1 /ASSEMBLY_ACC=CAM_ASM_000700 /TAXON_ID=215587 /ORGANISM="Aplanochytrium stocchinoi, Strain GSBS06" /LENGTH=302 /DNA_ID=CAMNT_0052029601 /DNA_START=171 /DNA_END=1079 /DNA_ORIENTATION=+
MISNGDPLTLFKTSDDIRRAESLLKGFEASQKMGTKMDENISTAELWEAKKLKDSAIHPDTGEIIPKPFRMAGYAAFNGPICVAMMASASTPALLFWNWVNQSQNALVNYSNRNASSPTTNEVLLKSYSAAVMSALTVAFGLSQLIKKRYTPSTAMKLLKFVAFPSSVIASCSNCYIMRSPEIKSGVVVTNGSGDILANGERSSVAARKAVEETVMSRAFLQVPVFFGTALTMSLPPVAALCAANPTVTVPLTTLVTMVMFGFGLPAAVAIFPQVGTIETASLEEHLQQLISDSTVNYNKGL